MMQGLSQSEICKQYGSPFFPAADTERVGVALSTLGRLPLNALRHQPEHGTCGWYIWGGAYSDSADFFQAMHVYHLVRHVPQLVPYLALAPGWRVLLAPEQTDIWYDAALLSV
jgi:hypothetical protein